MIPRAIGRREFIRIAGTGAAAVYFGGCATLGRTSGRSSVAGRSALDSIGPFDRTLGDVAPEEFSGDAPAVPHAVLRHHLGVSGKLPDPSEEAPIVIVGGGMSGILSAYFLRDHQPILLEQAKRLGGNSRGESWRGLDYSLATAYFDVPEKGGPIDQFFKEIGFDGKYRIRRDADPVWIGGKRYEDIWESGTNASNREQFRKLSQHFRDVVQGANGQVFPHIPIPEGTPRAHIDALDRVSFHAYLEQVAGERLHPELEEVIEHYFWSAGAASAREISAACGLNFFAADFDGVCIGQGGNGAIAEQVLERLLAQSPVDRLRTGALVFNIEVKEGGVIVRYLDVAKNELRAISARAAVVACPKFVAARIIPNLEPERKAVIRSQRYRSYLVANLLVNQGLPDSFYDLFYFSGPREASDVEAAAKKQRATDLVYGNFARPDASRTVLTVFRGFPYDGARKEIIADGAYVRFHGEFESQIQETVLPMLKIPRERVVDLRIARWGHPLPVPLVGNIASGRVDWLRKPFQERVFFVEQDNWALPCFETSFHEARAFAPEIARLVKQNT